MDNTVMSWQKQVHWLFFFLSPQKKHFSLINAPARDDEADFDDGEEEDDSR